MRVPRLLALVLIGLGLFVQSSAYAAARPASPEAMDRHCQEMMVQQAENAVVGSDEEPCTEKRLDCLVAMNCIAPLFLADSVMPTSLLAAERQAYTPLPASARLRSLRGPEPPPPEMRF